MKGALSRRGSLLALLALAFAVRVSGWSSVFRDGRVLFLDTDDYYHLRRILVGIANFPFLPTFDPYLGYPGGYLCIWPPLHDLALSALALVVGAGHPGPLLVQTTAALAPPVLGVATLAAFYLLARRLFGEWAALAALLFAALSPMSVQNTLLGRPDHHCIENLPFVLALFPCLGLLGRDDAGRPALRAFSAAALLSWGMLSWEGSFVFQLILFLVFAWDMRCGGADGASERRAWLAVVFAGQVPFLLALTAGNPWVRAGRMDFDAPTLFQPALCLVLAGLTFGIHRRIRRGWDALTASAFAAAGALGVLLLFGSMGSFAHFLAGSKTLARLAVEMQPFLSVRGAFAPHNAWDQFGGLLLLLPIGVVALAREGGTTSSRLLMVWLATTALLAVGQLRYVYHLTLPFCLLAGWTADRLWGKLSALRAPIRPLAKVAASAALIASLSPQLRFARGVAERQARTLGDGDLQAACEWIRDNTPATRSLYSDEGAPEYGVFALHSMGGEVAAIAQRPALAANMHTLPAEIDESIGFFFIKDAREAVRFLRERRMRYVLLPELLANGLLPFYARTFGIPGHRLKEGPGTLEIPPAMWESVYLRLYALDGSRAVAGSRSVPAVEGFRLVYESPHSRGGVHAFKLFEVVEGAPVRGRCRPGEAVQASVRLTSGQGRPFVYTDAAGCGGDGRFELRLPYPGRYELSVGARRRSLTIAD
ncbi:MAG: STT3 domain-containing protein [Elusimicrobiota bacterium]